MTAPAEIKIAARLVRKFSLRPPVDVECLAREFADLEFATLPVDADAITTHLKHNGKRPRIIVNQRRPPTRRRFTIAHEIGHIVIPWHVGTMTVSHVAEYESVDDPIYKAMESEANRFASELLMPTAWLRSLIPAVGLDISALHSKVQSVADVSMTSAAIGLARCLPTGHVFLELDQRRRVLYSGQSPGTDAQLYQDHSKVPDDPFPTASACAEIPTQQATFLWAFFSAGTKTRRIIKGDSGHVLDVIFKSMKLSSSVEQAKRHSVNGIIGSANNRCNDHSENGILSVLRQRFAARPELEAVIRHKSFDTFLRIRARELCAKWKTKR